jgi:hypothetical protein
MHEVDSISYFDKYFEEVLKEELILENEKHENIMSDYFIKKRKNRETINNSAKIKKF